MSFQDIGKIPRDFLSRDFVQSKDINKFVLTGPKTEKLQIKFSGQQIAGKVEGTSSILTLIEPVYIVDDQVTVRATFRSTTEVSGEIEANGKFAKGLKATLKVEHARDYKVTLTEEYRKNDFHGKLDLETPVRSPVEITAKAEGAYTYKQFLAGARAAVKVGTGLTEWGVGAQYKEGDYNVSVFADQKARFECGARIFYNLPKVAVAAEAIHTPGEELRYGLGWTRTLADRTGSVKSKLELPTGRFSFAYKTELGRATNVNSQLTVATSFNTFTGFGADPKFGINLDIQL